MNPYHVAVINALVPGLGYVLIKKRIFFGQMLLLSLFLGILMVFFAPEATLVSEENISFFLTQSLFGKFLEITSIVIGMFAFGYDGFQEAKKAQ